MAPPTWMVRGECQVCGDKIGPGSFYCPIHKDEKERGKPADFWVHHPAPPSEVIDVEASETTAGETPPASPYSTDLEPAAAGGGTWWQRIRKGNGKPGASSSSSSTKEKTPKRNKTHSTRGRVSAADDFSDLYSQLGGRLELTPHYPAGRMMKFQAESAGVTFDAAIAGTLPDRLLIQPLVRTRAKWEPLADMIMPPLLLVGMTNAERARQAAAAAGDGEGAQRAAQRVQYISGMLEWAIDRNLTSMLPAVKKAREDKAARDQAIADTFPELADAVDADGNPIPPARLVMMMLFEPPASPPPPSESESPDGVSTQVS